MTGQWGQRAWHIPSSSSRLVDDWQREVEAKNAARARINADLAKKIAAATTAEQQKRATDLANLLLGLLD